MGLVCYSVRLYVTIFDPGDEKKNYQFLDLLLPGRRFGAAAFVGCRLGADYRVDSGVVSRDRPAAS